MLYSLDHVAARSLMLKLMLGALALSALMGVAAILIEDDSMLGRVALTTLVIGVTCGVLIIANLLSLKPHLKWVGPWVGIVSTIEAALVFLLIWDEQFDFFRTFLVAQMMMLLFWFAWPIGIGLFFIRRDWGRNAGLLVVPSNLIALLLSVIASWSGRNYEVLYPISFAMFASGWTGGFALLGARPRPRAWQWAGAGAAGITFVLSVTLVYAEFVNRQNIDDNPLLDLTIVSGTVAAILGLAGLCWVVPLPDKGRWLRPVTLTLGGLALIGTAYVLSMSFNGRVHNSSMLAKLTVAGWICGGSSLAALFVLGSSHRYWLRAGSADGSNMPLECPVCGFKQTLPLGRNNCGRCHQPIWIWCRLETCQDCGYDLKGATSDCCPECGKELTTPITDPVFEAGD